MCGRYALALRPSQIRRMLEEDGVPVADAPDDEGSNAPRQSYNFAPGYSGIVYRADTPDRGAGPMQNHAHGDEEAGKAKDEEAGTHTSGAKEVRYKLQSMKWGLIPSWTKQNPSYAATMRTINCREDSLNTPGGMWATMKARKRCIVIAQGFFEWLNTGPKHKLPYYVKRKDDRLMCFAGLWDCVRYEGGNDKIYTYTIITTDSNKQLKFLHNRMPVIFDPGSVKVREWLDPSRGEWSRDLQSLLKPFDGELEVYPVSKDVGKVGNNSPSFIIPLDSEKNKSSIAKFFSSTSQPRTGRERARSDADVEECERSLGAKRKFIGDSQTDLAIASAATVDKKRKIVQETGNIPPAKKGLSNQQGQISSTRNTQKTSAKSRQLGTQRITNFFAPNSQGPGRR